MRKTQQANGIDHFDGESGVHLITFPYQAGLDCSTPGQDASESVAYWLPRVIQVGSDAELRQALQGYGAWDDLQEAPMDTILGRILWIAACDWRENR